ncbi:histone-lysine N-methyltransferase SETMAR-like [Pseudomyrmex gracilis]|uniref:histone-lysine N-methyltransferase SETMAR-like n=1 Tax=Pseudomyrmex gracilis TaxID=219809 RepID=UPI00099503CC|nr:histone-lysine N-methyltransferase SETMAR-like [Pseudomyrmex gracilis]
MHGVGSVSERTVQRWFKKFRDGNYNLIDERPGRPIEIDNDQISSLIENNPHYTTQEIAEILGISKSSVKRHLCQLGLIFRYGIWIPHNLSEKNLVDRIAACNSLLKRNENESFLERLVTGNAKWIVYTNVIQKRHRNPESNLSVTPKVISRPKKILLCVWWDWKGILFYELLPPNQLINSDKYCSQLDRLNENIKEKRPELANRKGVVFHQDTARSHVSVQSQQKLRELDWDVLNHPPYSPDLAPSDFYLFRFLQDSLNGETFDSLEAFKMYVSRFFAAKDAKFWEDSITKLPARWQKVIDQNGQYIK